jgi:DNA-binding NarL/FixJ family response regulator
MGVPGSAYPLDSSLRSGSFATVPIASRCSNSAQRLAPSESGSVRRTLPEEGRTNSEIATQLFLSSHTVDTHRRHSFQKLDLSSRVGLTRAALARGGLADQ